MKRTTKIIIYNIIFVLIILLTAELICCIKQCNFYLKNVEKNKKYVQAEKSITCKYILKLKYLKTVFLHEDDFRAPQGLQYNKNNKESSSIVLLGCSFTHGYGLKDNETFSYFLSEQTKRPVYNLGVIGAGQREALYILRSPKIRSSLIPRNDNIKYFIYTYIPAHKHRLYRNNRIHVPNFKYDKSYTKLKYYKDYLNNKTCLVPELMNLYSIYLFNNEKAFKLIKLYFKQIKKIIDKDYKNYDEPTKLIILIYVVDDGYNWKELEEENIKIINLKSILNVNLRDAEYTIDDAGHPNAKAWEVIVPALVKELNL